MVLTWNYSILNFNNKTGIYFSKKDFIQLTEAGNCRIWQMYLLVHHRSQIGQGVSKEMCIHTNEKSKAFAKATRNTVTLSCILTSAKELCFSVWALYGLSWVWGIWGGFCVLFATVAARLLSACWKFCSILCSWRRENSFRTSTILICHFLEMLAFFKLPLDHGVIETVVPQQLRHQNWVAGAQWAQLKHQ